MRKLTERVRRARNIISFPRFLLLCMRSGRKWKRGGGREDGRRCLFDVQCERDYPSRDAISCLTFVRSFVGSLGSSAHSLVHYLLLRRRKMRASHLHVKSNKTSARFTAKVTRHFSHFATHPRYTIFWQKEETGLRATAAFSPGDFQVSNL